MLTGTSVETSEDMDEELVPLDRPDNVGLVELFRDDPIRGSLLAFCCKSIEGFGWRGRTAYKVPLGFKEYWNYRVREAQSTGKHLLCLLVRSAIRTNLIERRWGCVVGGEQRRIAVASMRWRNRFSLRRLRICISCIDRSRS